jgi:hypothetical protein
VASSQYILKAMDHFRQKFRTPSNEVLFVMASDDIKWCQLMFSKESDVVLASTMAKKYSVKQPTFDMAVLSNCNHSI